MKWYGLDGIIKFTIVGTIAYYGHTFGFLAHIAILIVTGVFRFNEAGTNCALDETPIVYNEDGDTFTFAEHGSMMSGLFIATCVLLCFYNCFVFVLMKLSKLMIDVAKGNF